MLGWVWRKFVGRFHSCSHSWADKERIEYNSGAALLFVLQCKFCGDLKSHRIEA